MNIAVRGVQSGWTECPHSTCRIQPTADTIPCVIREPNYFSPSVDCVCYCQQKGEVRLRDKHPQMATGGIVIPLNEAAPVCVDPGERPSSWSAVKIQSLQGRVRVPGICNPAHQERVFK